MQIAVGAFFGFVAGLGVWRLTVHFAGRYDAPSIAGRLAAAVPLLRDVQGIVALPAALALGGMVLWGAYLGWWASDLLLILSPFVVTALFLTISLVDFQARRIPNPLVLALLLWAVVQALWFEQPSLDAAALGLLVGGGVFFVLALLGRGAMGAGDVKLAAALGAVLGYPLVFYGLFWGIVAGGAAALVLLVTRRAGRKDTMAYGPYLALGSWLVWTNSLGIWPWSL